LTGELIAFALTRGTDLGDVGLRAANVDVIDAGAPAPGDYVALRIDGTGDWGSEITWDPGRATAPTLVNSDVDAAARAAGIRWAVTRSEGDGGSVTVRAVRDGSDIDITVTDTGIGVPEADRERIFESFQQGGRGGSREEGTGLGLTLSRRIVELLGGHMWLETEVGRGSTFGFSIPARERQAAATSEDGGPLPVGGEVVVIEDDRPSLDLFRAYLSRAALQVTTARDGQSGLAAVRRTRPDAVLLDIRLPGIDGWAVLKALKEEEETRDIPVIVVSIVDERTRGVAMGAAAYLVKPVGRDALLAALAGVGVPVPAHSGPSTEAK